LSALATNIADEKRDLRHQARARLSQISAEQHKSLSAAAMIQLLARPEWQNAQLILGYLPLKDELDLSAALEWGVRASKTIALPRYLPDEGRYCASIITESVATLSPGAFGVREPDAAAPVLSLKQLDFILVPGVAFDPSGRRIGRGKGFYDRLLAETNSSKCVKCGIALDEQIVPRIPSEPHDIAMNVILTPTRWLHISAPGA
jgi:5-formyltetrahydrofolate cyclo-ligase